MAADFLSAHTTRESALDAAEDLLQQLAPAEPVAIAFFATFARDGKEISRLLRERLPGVEVIGCTTAGEFTNQVYGAGGIAAVGFSRRKVKRCAATLARFEQASVEAGVQAAGDALAARMGDLRELDPGRHIGLVLNTGLNGNEEKVNEVLGHVAPFLSFIGGSAGDDFALKETRVFCNGEESLNGSALLLLETTVPYAIVKACSFVPTETSFEMTKVAGRVVYELDGKPVLPTYAAAVGASAEKLDHSVFMGSPLGLMIDGKPWVRSPIQALPDGGLLFGCAMLEGSRMHLLKSTDLVRDTREAIAEGVKKLGGPPSGAVFFNCAHRRIEVQVKALEGPFREILAQVPVAGFHCYGESWLGHMNQTLVALLLG